jgi:tRNA1(Val) A37 N6-methylase TrmN6
MGFSDSELTCDRFLGGRISAFQPKSGYRAGVDPVLLAACVPVRSGESVLELGCGAGVASLCLASRVAGVQVSGVEVQPDYAELARKNADHNRIGFEVHCADICALPRAVLARSFDHVIANPPYYLRQGGTIAQDPGRERALGEQTPLAEWVDVATRRLKPGGYLTFIQDAERIAGLLSAFDTRIGSLKMQPFAPRTGRDARLVVIQARKGGRGVSRLMAPLVMHEGPEHVRDGESYTATIRAVLREGAALELAGCD